LDKALLMSKTGSGSTLYRLIEAGHLARHALLTPLFARGLEQGDDAILLGLADPAGAAIDDLVEFTGLGTEQLDDKLRRLEDKGLLLRLAVGPELVPGARLSQQGQATRDSIEAHWRQLEEAISEDLGKKDRKSLRQSLKRIITLLRL
jgi:DNA-binding MarR family transcriptional regulator